MGARQSQQKARSGDLDITDIAANQSPAASAAHSSTHPALSSATASPALTSLSSKTSKLAQQAWGAPQQSRYIQHDTKAEDQVTEWKPDEEEKQTADDDDGNGSGGKGAVGEDLFGKYKSGEGGGAGGAGKRSGIVSGVKAASGVERRQQAQPTTSGMNTLMEDDEGVDDSAVSNTNNQHHTALRLTLMARSVIVCHCSQTFCCLVWYVCS